MNINQIRTGIEDLKPWFHQIDLGQGIVTKTSPAGNEPVDHPAGTWQIVQQALPGDLTGKSVLDVGCNAGFYAFQAKRRKAARVLGIDSQNRHVRQGLFARDVLGLDVSFERMSVYDLSPATVGEFDVTLALGLLYHCKHIVLAMERLFQVTRDLLIVESAVLPESDRFQPYADALGGVERWMHALSYCGNTPAAKEAVFNWFIPSVSCLEAMLRDTGFVDFSILSTANGRVVLTCHKPRAVPDSAGMPHLLSAKLRFEDGSSQVMAGNPVQFRIRAENTGQATWLAQGPATGTGTVALGAHLLNQDRREVAHDWGRTPVPSDVASGGAAVLMLAAQSPCAPGKYYVEFDMVSERLTWFEDNGDVPLVRELEII